MLECCCRKLKKFQKIPTDGWLSQHQLGFLFLLVNSGGDIEIIYDIRSAVILVLLDRNNFINISNSVGRHHWRPLVNADKAADILSGVLHSMSGMLYILIR